MKEKSKIRIIPLGGLKEIGKNCTLIEYEDEILIIDFGLKFGNEDTPGIDFTVNSLNYLINNKNKVKGILITHGHLDHIGGLPYLLNEFNIPIYASDFTCAMINNLKFKKSIQEKLILKPIKENQNIKIGKFEIDTVKIGHSIINCLGYIFKTKNGNIIHTGDYKDNRNSYKEKNTDFKQLSRYKNNILLLSDSTNAGNKEKTTSDKVIYNNLKKIISNTKGRIIISTFSTQITRIRQILDICKEKKKKVIISGFAISNNIEMGIRMNFLKNFEDILLKTKNKKKIEDKNIVFICTGTQGEKNSAIHKISNNNHPHIKLLKSDTVVFCSSVIPGNEFKVNKIINQLYEKEVNVITNKDIEIHSSGHGGTHELKKIINIIKPKYFIPIHGEKRHLERHKKIALNCGINEKNILVLENGQKIEIYKKKIKKLEKIKNKFLYINNNKILTLDNSVFKKRENLTNSGIIIIIIKLDHNSDIKITIENHGFVLYNDSKDIIKIIKENIINEVKNNIKQYYNDDKKNNLKIKSLITEILNKKKYTIPVISVNFIF